jgi:hypothetical protein
MIWKMIEMVFSEQLIAFLAAKPTSSQFFSKGEGQAPKASYI